MLFFSVTTFQNNFFLIYLRLNILDNVYKKSAQYRKYTCSWRVKHHTEMASSQDIYTQIKSWNIYFFFVVLLDFHKLDEWEVIIESDLKTMEWEDSEDSEGKNFNK